MVLRIEAELLRHDLRPRRLVTLTLRFGPGADETGAGRMDADLGAVEHLDPENVEVLRRPGTDHFGERGDADAHQLAARPLLRLLLEQVLIADHLERLVQRLVVVAAVVGEAERRWYGNCSLLMKFLRRSSTASRPSSSARTSIARSIA